MGWRDGAYEREQGKTEAEMKHLAILTGDDIQTILDGCYMERMELVARIRGTPGLCPHQGMDNGCHFGAPCQFQRIDYSVPVGISCGRESAALAVAEAAEQEQAGDHP